MHLVVLNMPTLMVNCVGTSSKTWFCNIQYGGKTMQNNRTDAPPNISCKIIKRSNDGIKIELNLTHPHFISDLHNPVTPALTTQISLFVFFFILYSRYLGALLFVMFAGSFFTSIQTCQNFETFFIRLKPLSVLKRLIHATQLGV